MNWKNEITERLKIKYPILQAPMLGVTTPEMVAAISNEGGLGTLAVGSMPAEVVRKLIQKTKSLTSKPFAVNLFAYDLPADLEKDVVLMKQFLLDLANKKGYPITEEDMSKIQYAPYTDVIEVLIEEKVSVVSFTFGCLDKKSIESLKAADCVLIGTATCLEEALVLDINGIDMFSAQGIEAGGHRGTFIGEDKLPEIGLFSLIRQIVMHTKKPVIAAGGIHNHQTIKAAFTLGAKGVQIGSAFIGSDESKATAAYKNQLKTSADRDTKLTKAFSGKWARGIKNEMMEEIENSGLAIPVFPIQNSLTAKIREYAQLEDDVQYTSLWGGQSSNNIQFKPCSEIFKSLLQ